MTMFKGYAHMVDFFTSFDWWDTEPHDELVNDGQLLPGETRGDLRRVPPPRRLRDRANSARAVWCHVVGSGDGPADRATVLQRHCTRVDLACGTWRGRLGLSLEALHREALRLRFLAYCPCFQAPLALPLGPLELVHDKSSRRCAYARRESCSLGFCRRAGSLLEGILPLPRISSHPAPPAFSVTV